VSGAPREIRIENARSHNLKGVTCGIPLRALTVVSGVSGSGKSTLAFDTLYAEGQRRYVTSLSTYARQFLERLPRPEVDFISNLPPAIAIEQRNRVTNARSTVGTATEILDHLRLLFARAGKTRCPDCDVPVAAGNVAAVAARIRERFAGQAVSLAGPVAGLEGETPLELQARLARDGFIRILDSSGQVFDITEFSGDALARVQKRALLLIDRLEIGEQTPEARLAEGIASAFARGHGELVVWPRGGEPTRFREGFACDSCGRTFPAPEPALFSFNSPLGACEACQGFGRVQALDFGRVVPDERRSLEADAIAPFATPAGREMKRLLLRACRAEGISVRTPFSDLSQAERRFVLEGDDSAVDGDGWEGVRGYFRWLEGRRYKVQARVLIARYRRFDPCPSCGGARLREEARAVRVADADISQLSVRTIAELAEWTRALELDPAAAARCERLLGLLRARLETAEAVGLGYIALDRQVRTLSGGEAQRIQLSTALGGSLTAALYVLDEPSIGLHARDVSRLLAVLAAIRDQGNTVVVVEHAPEVVGAADHVLDLGPRAGREGGELLFEGSVEELRSHPESATARALRGELRTRESRGHAKRRGRGKLVLRGARGNNLAGVDVEIPLGKLVVFSGVSGAGKSTLVRSVLVEKLRAELGLASGETERGVCEAIEGARQVLDVVVVDQSPASRSPRSNPATVSKAFDGIRKLFAGTRQARALGVAPGWFSFNVPGGRCDTCEGAGELVIDMQFLDDVRVPCDDCGGLRYRREVLDVTWQGRTIVDVLAMTVDEALVSFRGEKRITRALEPLAQVGLGYLSLGQPLSTLSGGEHQRLRLALALAEGRPGSLYVLDEPTTGLHPADVELLLRCFDALLDAGGSVLVVEHDLEVIRQADHVIDLGPEGGPGGGRVMATGTPEEIARTDTHTGAALRASER